MRGPGDGVCQSLVWGIIIRTSHPLVVDGILGTCISHRSAQKLPCIRRRSVLYNWKSLHVNIKSVTGRKRRAQKMGGGLIVICG